MSVMDRARGDLHLRHLRITARGAQTFELVARSARSPAEVQFRATITRAHGQRGVPHPRFSGGFHYAKLERGQTRFGTKEQFQGLRLVFAKSRSSLTLKDLNDLLRPGRGCHYDTPAFAADHSADVFVSTAIFILITKGLKGH